MTDYKIPRAPHIESAIVAACNALDPIVIEEHTVKVAEADLSLSELMEELRFRVDETERTVAAQLGPLTFWRGPRRDFELTVAGIDLDGGHRDFSDIIPGDGMRMGQEGGWHGSALNQAASAYRREAHWDHAPGDAGVWVVMLAPIMRFDGEEEGTARYTGHLVGFMIVHDRDEDGVYESVAHMWTATAWRRKGIARRLMAEARSHFPITGVEGPNTRDGDAFLTAVGGPEAAGDE